MTRVDRSTQPSLAVWPIPNEGRTVSSKLLTAQQVAEQRGIKLWTVRAMARRGCPHLFLGSKLFFTEDGVDLWIAQEIARSIEKARKSGSKQKPTS